MATISKESEPTFIQTVLHMSDGLGNLIAQVANPNSEEGLKWIKYFEGWTRVLNELKKTDSNSRRK